jgi:hypothetical protein
MLMIFNTRAFLPEAAYAASVEPCWHTPLDSGRLAGSRMALVERWMR